MLALDALDRSLIDRLCTAGQLPNLADFRANGVSLGVESDGEVLHGSVWPTFASGTGPGSHGLYFWTQWLAEEQRHVRNSHAAFAFEPFWAAFPEQGKRATIIDLPYVPLIQGPGMRALLGWGIHDEVERASHPASFIREVERRVGRNPLSFDTLEPYSGPEKLKMARSLRDGVQMRGRLVAQLAAEDEWDLMLVNFGEFHKAGHYLAGPEQLSKKTSNQTATAAVVRALDQALPAILSAAGPRTDVFIFALHGMQEQSDFAPFGPQILDLLAGRTPLDPDANPDLLRRLRNRIPARLHREVWRRLPAKVRAARQGQLSMAGADRSEPIFNVAHDTSPGFRLNMRGRELRGELDVTSGAALLSELETLVLSFRVADGQQAFSEVIRPALRWPGARAGRLPDALAQPARTSGPTPTLARSEGLALGSIRVAARNGAHTGHGFCFVRPGGPFATSRNAVDARDFAPSVLQLLGASAPGSLEGTSFVA